MVEGVGTKSSRWRGGHLHLLEILTGPGGEWRRARCLGCGGLGQLRTDLAAARRVLRGHLAGPENA
jgi:hypothetical protein